MVILDVRLNNFYAFRNFHMNLTYPKKIVDSSIKDEHLAGRPNFRYKKVNIIMGANASGKTTFGHMLMNIFNFIEKKNYELLADAVCDRNKESSFLLDMVIRSNTLYRIVCRISPRNGEKYSPEDFALEIRREPIRSNDSYESCIKRINEAPYSPAGNYIDELEKMESLDWMFEYPRDTGRILTLPDNDNQFRFVLESVLKALDPSIQSVEISQDVKKAYVIRLKDRAAILQDGDSFIADILSSGTKAGVEIARVISLLMQRRNTFYYCDEKFSYIHTDIEKAIISLMIEYLQPGDQLFFTTHNTDILDMDLPKHTFTFLHKDITNPECPVTCIAASSLLKRNTDSLKRAVENDLFSCAPAVDLIYAIRESENGERTDEEYEE